MGRPSNGGDILADYVRRATYNGQALQPVRGEKREMQMKVKRKRGGLWGEENPMVMSIKKLIVHTPLVGKGKLTTGGKGGGGVMLCRSR